MSDLLTAALAELRLWRMLVNEGGVPRYTVTPGAALNEVVTGTDALLRRHAQGMAVAAASETRSGSTVGNSPVGCKPMRPEPGADTEGGNEA